MSAQERLCFGASPGQGNAALVVEGDAGDSAARLAFAREHNKPACVFLDGGSPWVADYYYPHQRSPLCLHATLAAAHVLFAHQGHDAPIVLQTAWHGQQLRLIKETAMLQNRGQTPVVQCFEESDEGGAMLNNRGLSPVVQGRGIYYVALEQQVAPVLGWSAAEAARLAVELCGMPGLALAAAPAIASVGSPKLLITVTSRADLYALRPPLERIQAWGRAHGVNGCYVVCQVGEDAYEGRNFNHLDPALEDSATGVAAGALTAHLGRPLILHQGQARGQDCLIRTRLHGNTILVGGAVETK